MSRVLPKGTVVRHLTYTGEEKPGHGASSFKQRYAQTCEWAEDEQCALCQAKATLGAHMEAELEPDDEKEWVVLHTLARGLLPCCAGCNHNLRHTTKTYRLERPAAMALLTRAEVRRINERQIQATATAAATKAKSGQNGQNGQKSPARKSTSAETCAHAGCNKPICSRNPDKCGGYSRKHCCLHYRVRKNGKVACRVRRGKP